MLPTKATKLRKASVSMRQAVLVFSLVLLALPGLVRAEAISSFTSDITVNTDGSFQVVEVITYDFGAAERHGIFRTLPLSHPQTASTWYRERVIDVEIVTVARASEPEMYDVSRSGDELRLKIGDPNQTITGTHTYTIRYDVAGGLTYYEDGAVDLYWNVTGDEWDVPIRQAEVTVYTTSDILVPTRSCYVGSSGEQTPCADTTVATSSVMFTTGTLSSGEGLTIAQALDPESVKRDVREKWNIWWLWLSLGGLWLFGLAIAAYRVYTKHDPGDTVVPQYEPYKDFKPMFAGLLLDGQLHSRDITAGILYLAEQGFVTIRKTERKILWLFDTSDYDLDLLRSPIETETVFQRELLTLLFGQASVGATVALSELKNDQTKQRKNQKIIRRLEKNLKQDLRARNFYEANYAQVLRGAVFAIVGLFVVVTVAVVFSLAEPALLVAAGILSLLTIIILSAVAHRRTAKGYEARNYLRGFKEFLSVTGKDRFAFHDAPEKSPEQFTEYLPYAVAFGVEAAWAEVFKDVTIPQPGWYDDGSGTGQFAAASLVHDLSSFSSSFSQSSGTSASSGGGSSGGGAGGGGGGSW